MYSLYGTAIHVLNSLNSFASAQKQVRANGGVSAQYTAFYLHSWICSKDYDSMGHIRNLEPCLVAKVRSGFVIQSLAQAVEECLCNSLDAGADEICVRIQGNCDGFEVEDNGVGIPILCFKTVATRYATSKISQLSDLRSGIQTYGFRGESLSSLAECAVLQITSRPAGQFETWTKVICGDRVLKCGLSQVQRRSRGTLVLVRDFQYNQPVRKKQTKSRRHASFHGGLQGVFTSKAFVCPGLVKSQLKHLKTLLQDVQAQQRYEGLHWKDIEVRSGELISGHDSLGTRR